MKDIDKPQSKENNVTAPAIFSQDRSSVGGLSNQPIAACQIPLGVIKATSFKRTALLPDLI